MSELLRWAQPSVSGVQRGGPAGILGRPRGWAPGIMSARHILQSFEAWRAAREPLVLATVYDTLGSTYSKAGHRILIAGSGDYRGLVSGGCLEGDLAERAREVISVGSSVAPRRSRQAAASLFGVRSSGGSRRWAVAISPARSMP